jgi:hypothetical protein
MISKKERDWNRDEGREILKGVSTSFQKINLDDPENYSNKVLSEKETRKRLLSHASIVGCYKEMLMLFSKFDKLLNNCNNDKERSDIGKMGSLEMYRLLGGGGELYIDGQLVCKDN